MYQAFWPLRHFYMILGPVLWARGQWGLIYNRIYITLVACPFWSKNIPSCNLTVCMPFCQFSFDVSSLHYVLGYQMLPLSLQSLIKFRNGGKLFQVFMYENVMFTFNYRQTLYILSGLFTVGIITNILLSDGCIL